MDKIVTKANLSSRLTDDNTTKVMHTVGRALVVLLNNQTSSESQLNTTNVQNGIGFTGADARQGSICAKTYIKHGKLFDWQLERWLSVGATGNICLAKYWKQLNVAANAKRRITN